MTFELPIDDFASPPTLLENGGPLLSMEQFGWLLAAAQTEGLELDMPSVPREMWESSEFQRDWQDLLAAIALYGPARVVLPSHLAAEVDIQPLLEREIAEILILDTTEKLRRQMASTYDQAFSCFRELEHTRGCSPLISLDEPPLTAKERLGAELLLDEARFHYESLKHLIKEPLIWLEDIFGYYIQINEDFVRSSMANFNQGIYEDDSTFQLVDPGRRASDLLKAMGLYVRDRGLLEGMGLQQKGLAYYPSWLSDFAELDRKLTSRPEDLGGYLEMGLRLTPVEKSEFLAVHAFWSTFFQLMNMLDLAGLLDSPLHLPSTTSVRQSQALGGQIEGTSETVRIYRLFLSESGRLPNPASLQELERIRSDPGLSSLRSMLAQWTKYSMSADEGDADLLLEMRNDIELATKRLKRAHYLSKVGSLVTYVSLPIAIYDATQGSAMGVALTPVGAAVDRLAAVNAKRANWIRIGSG